MVIFFGIYFLFKRDRFRWRTFCPACGQMAHMSSFTGWEVFHIFFIPIAPIGRMRVAVSCPMCKQLCRTSLKKAKAGVDDALSQAKAAVAEGRTGDVTRILTDCVFSGGTDRAAEFLSGIDGGGAWMSACRGFIAFVRGEYAQAERDARETVRLSPDDAGARALLAKILLDQRRTEEAVAEFRQAARLDPTDADSRCELMLIYRDQKRWDELLVVMDELAAMKSHVTTYRMFPKFHKKARKWASRSAP